MIVINVHYMELTHARLTKYKHFFSSLLGRGFWLTSEVMMMMVDHLSVETA